jgi:hypothetical protein
MSTLKIEHANPNTAHPIAFDVMSGDEVRETIVLAPNHFKIIELSGGLVLHEVSERERKAKEDAEHAEKVEAERVERKAKIEAEAGNAESKSEPGADDGNGGGSPGRIGSGGLSG